MPIQPKQYWVEKVNTIQPTDSSPKGLKALVTAVAGGVSNKAGLKTITGKLVFTFNQTIFYQQLILLTPVPLSVPGVTQYVKAWTTAITPSVMLVPAGSFIGVSTPATLFSVVTKTTLDPASLTKASKQLQKDLLKQANAPVKTTAESDFGPAFMRAFQALTYTITGLDSTPPNAGPKPLVAKAKALL